MSSGWLLFGCVLVLLAYQLRKSVYLIPLGKMSSWRRFHILLSLVWVLLFILHVLLHPEFSALEFVILFLLTISAVTGFLSWRLSRTLPGLLTQTGGNLLYGSLLRELNNLKTETEDRVLEHVRSTGNKDLAERYAQLSTPGVSYIQRGGMSRVAEYNACQPEKGKGCENLNEELKENRILANYISRRSELETQTFFQRRQKRLHLSHMLSSTSLLLLIFLHVFQA